MMKIKKINSIKKIKEYKKLLIKYQLDGIHLLKSKRKAIQKIIFLLSKSVKVLMGPFARLK